MKAEVILWDYSCTCSWCYYGCQGRKARIKIPEQLYCTALNWTKSSRSGAESTTHLGKCTKKDTAMREDVIKGKGWMRQHIYMQRITRNKQQVWEQLQLITGDRQIELNTRQTTKMKQEETEHGKRNSDMTRRQKDKQAPKQDWLHKKSQGTQGRRVKLI